MTEDLKPSSGAVDLRASTPVAEVILNRPLVKNALDLSMCIGLRSAFESIDRNLDIRVTLLRGAGGTFCSGADLKERAGKDEEWVRHRRLAAFSAYAAIERCRTPVIAVVNGDVVGSGGEIALAADFIVATQNTKFWFPEAHWGTVGATQRLQRAIGKRRAKEFLFTARKVSANEALQLGLVSVVVPDDALENTAKEIAERICQAPPLSIALTKQAMDLGSETDLDRGIRIEVAAIERCLADGQWRDGVADFTRRMASGSPKEWTYETSLPSRGDP